MRIQLRKIGWLKNRKSLLAIALIVLALIAFGAYHVFRPDAPVPPKTEVITHSTDKPNEAKLDDKEAANA